MSQPQPGLALAAGEHANQHCSGEDARYWQTESTESIESDVICAANESETPADMMSKKTSLANAYNFKASVVAAAVAMSEEQKNDGF